MIAAAQHLARRMIVRSVNGVDLARDFSQVEAPLFVIIDRLVSDATRIVPT